MKLSCLLLLVHTILWMHLGGNSLGSSASSAPETKDLGDLALRQPIRFSTSEVSEARLTIHGAMGKARGSKLKKGTKGLRDSPDHGLDAPPFSWSEEDFTKILNAHKICWIQDNPAAGKAAHTVVKGLKCRAWKIVRKSSTSILRARFKMYSPQLEPVTFRIRYDVSLHRNGSVEIQICQKRQVETENWREMIVFEGSCSSAEFYNVTSPYYRIGTHGETLEEVSRSLGLEGETLVLTEVLSSLPCVPKEARQRFRCESCLHCLATI